MCKQYTSMNQSIIPSFDCLKQNTSSFTKIIYLAKLKLVLLYNPNAIYS